MKKVQRQLEVDDVDYVSAALGPAAGGAGKIAADWSIIAHRLH